MTRRRWNGHRASDGALVVAAVLPSLVFLIGGFSTFGLLWPVPLAVLLFVLVRVTRGRWQPLAIVAVLPGLAEALAASVRLPGDTPIYSLGEVQPEFWKLRILVPQVVALVLVPIAGWLAARLRPQMPLEGDDG